MMLLVGESMRALRQIARPQGFNVGMNLGKVAGAGVAEHVHIHVVPRWNGDTDFMAVTADLRKIPEMLPETFDRLLEAMKLHAGTAKPKRKRTAARRVKTI
jgi:ATP adenylyltransferase